MGTVPAKIDANSRRVTAASPESARVYYLNLVNKGGLIVSTEHHERGWLTN